MELLTKAFVSVQSLNFISNEVLMKIQRCFTIRFALLLLPVLLMASFATADDKKKDSSKDVCSNPNPASICTRRQHLRIGFHSVYGQHQADLILVLCHPQHSRRKGNDLFCVKTGTTVTWQSTAKNTGFLVDPGAVFAVRSGWHHHGRQRKVGFGRGQDAGCLNYHFRPAIRKADLRQEQGRTGQLIVVGGQ